MSFIFKFSCHIFEIDPYKYSPVSFILIAKLLSIIQITTDYVSVSFGQMSFIRLQQRMSPPRAQVRQACTQYKRIGVVMLKDSSPLTQDNACVGCHLALFMRPCGNWKIRILFAEIQSDCFLHWERRKKSSSAMTLCF